MLISLLLSISTKFWNPGRNLDLLAQANETAAKSALTSRVFYNNTKETIPLQVFF